MSEPLVVRFEHNGLPVAAVFGRWAAYTTSAATITDFNPSEEMGWNEFRSNLLPILMNRQALKEGHFKSKDGLHVYTAIDS